MDLSAVDMNEVLHAQRTAQLRRTPKGADVFLSAGCSGGWYFDWIESAYGPVERHIGVEYYSPRPEQLPDYVTWIANTVGNMEAVADASVDLVFSGQNVEHLWPADVVGFLAESNRVLRPGGRLVMDSPNRELTGPLNWSHPEHTVELTPPEAVELCRLAGFDVDRVAGLWRCRSEGRVLPFGPGDEIELIDRSMSAVDAPDDSFIWWIEASRAGPADRRSLADRVDQIFATAWPERLQRLIPLQGTVADDGTTVTSLPDTEGVLFFGPYTPLPAGKHRIVFRATALEDAPQSPGWCDVMADEEVVAVEDLPPMRAGETGTATIEIDLAEQRFGIQFRMMARGSARIQAPLTVEITHLDPSPMLSATG